MAYQKPTIVYGTAGVVAFSTEVLDQMLNTLEKHNVKELDTAFVYVCSSQPEKCTFSDFNRYLVKRSSERLVRQADSRSLRKRLAGKMAGWPSRMFLMA
jgi:hypothetical protein